MKVYLAGGMRTEWRSVVKSAAPQHTYFDPALHGLYLPKQYTKWDLDHIKKADIVFAVMEQTNPSGVGLALEVGYGRGLGKKILLVNLSDNKYFPIVECASDVVYDSLGAGVLGLLSIKEPYRYELPDDIDDWTYGGYGIR